MTAEQKLFQVLLIDGDINGCVECFSQNWNVIAYKIPRNKVAEHIDDVDMNRAGVYFLFGAPDEDSLKAQVYIGQAGKRGSGDALITRVSEHVKGADDESYWTEAVLITTVDDTWGATEISFLENYFYKLASEASRYEVRNENTPASGHPRKEREIELVEAVQMGRYFLGILGHKVLEPLVGIPNTEDVAKERGSAIELTGHTKDGKGYGVQTSDGFVLKKGSVIASDEAASLPDPIKKLRQEIELDANRALKKDVLFKRPSPAAQVVAGSTVSGSEFWQDKDGRKLKDLDL